MAVVSESCQRCAAPGEKIVGQHADAERIVWFGSFACERCGLEHEEDGDDPLPERWREAILAQEGEWELVVHPRDPFTVLRVLRAALNLSMADVPALKARLPGAVCSGTPAEMGHLRLRLLEAGEEARIVRRS